MIIFILLIVFSRASGLINELNGTQYSRMPSLFRFDPYELCVEQESGIYCTVDIDLVSDERSELLTMIKEYSERKETHFNHTRLTHGICVTKMCEKYIKGNMTVDKKVIIEKCLNESFWKEYGLRTKINEEPICSDEEKDIEFDSADIAVSVLLLCFAIFNLVGSVYDYFIKKEDDKGNKWLLSFSVKQNWRKLTAPTMQNAEPRVQRMKGFNGIRALTISLVTIVHSTTPLAICIENTHLLEATYSQIAYHLFYDGTIFVQTFFAISGCLLAYNLEKISEKLTLTWTMVPKGIFMRYLRLTPSYAVVLAVSTTLIRFAGSGPLWQKIMGREVQDCRTDWWRNLLYINNYYDKTECMMHTWYLAADMQLFILGMVILVLAKSERSRKIILPVIFIVALIIPALHTYLQNLDAYVIGSPELGRAFYRFDATLNNNYKRGHSNMICHLFGIFIGLTIRRYQKINFNIENSTKLKYFYWAIVPVAITMVLVSSLFYSDGAVPPLLLKAVYSSALKAIYGVLASFLIFGLVFKIENVYRPILEWRGWTTPARVSYSAYVIHLMVVHVLVASRSTLIRLSPIQVFLQAVGTSFLSYLVAFPFWILIEAPLTQIIKRIMPAEKKETEPDMEIGENNKI